MDEEDRWGDEDAHLGDGQDDEWDDEPEEYFHEYIRYTPEYVAGLFSFVTVAGGVQLREQIATRICQNWWADSAHLHHEAIHNRFHHFRVQAEAVLGYMGGGCARGVYDFVELKKPLIREMEFFTDFMTLLADFSPFPEEAPHRCVELCRQLTRQVKQRLAE